MKTNFFKSFILVVFSSLFLAGTCSSDDDSPNDDNNEMPYETISQNIINQEFFIEGIYITGPQREEIKPLPHAVAQVPISSKEFFEIEAGFLESETVYFGITGQRLLDEEVSGESQIANPLSAKPFDHSHIVFVVDNENDSHSANAKLESIESITRVSENNDVFDQVNFKITNARFKVTAIEEGVLGYTNNGSPIQSVIFTDNESAFIDNTDGNIVVGFLGDFNQLLQTTFGNSEEVFINILERSSNISNTLDRTRFYVD